MTPPTSTTPSSTSDGSRLRDFRPRRKELKDVGRLAFPVVAVQVGMMAMGVVDTLMVGRVSAVDLAAVALGHIYFSTVTVFGMGILMALDPIVAQGVGAANHTSIRRAIQRGLVLSVVLAIGGAVALFPGEPLLRLLSQPDEVVPVTAEYARASIPGVLPYFAFVVFRQTLQAMGRVTPIVWIIVGANVANFFFNWVLIYGNLGMQPMGAVGSGWASSLSRTLMAVGLLVLAWPLIGRYLSRFDLEALAPGPLVHMVRIGVPVGIQFELEFGAFAVTSLLMGLLGTTAVAAHQVALNLASFTFMVPLGIAQAAAVVVGRAVGRRDSAGVRRAGGGSLLLGGGFMMFTGLLFLLAPEFLARLYTSDPAVVGLAVVLIPIAGLFQVFDGVQAVAAGVLRGVGDTRAPMVVSMLGFWIIGMPVSLVLGFGMEQGPSGLWWGLAAGLAAVAGFLLVRIRSHLRGDVEPVALGRLDAKRFSSGAPGGTPTSDDLPMDVPHG